MKNFIFFLFILLLSSCYRGSTEKQTENDISDSWVMSGLGKKDGLNPILQSFDAITFICPISGREINWEERNVLNLSAIVKGNKVQLFYRAQDKKGIS